MSEEAREMLCLFVILVECVMPNPVAEGQDCPSVRGVPRRNRGADRSFSSCGWMAVLQGLEVRTASS